MIDPPRSNAEWVRALKSAGAARDAALDDLRRILRRGLPQALSPWIEASDPRFAALADEVVQESLLKILSGLDGFAGRSRFTTWAYRIAVRAALSELRRKRWQDVPLEGLVEAAQVGAPGLVSDAAAGPEAAAQQADLLARVQRAIAHGLTQRQRTALVALAVQGMPAEEVARRLGIKRNALYKLVHDARVRLRSRLAEDGLTPEEILAAFQPGKFSQSGDVYPEWRR